MIKQPLYEQRISNQQKEVLLDFMDAHPEFSKTKLLGVEGRKTKNALWAVLTEQLNACEGPSKTAEKWQRVWADLKTKTKRKAADIKASRSKTGGGPGCSQILNAFDEKIINLLSEEAVHGLEGPDGVQLDSEERSGPSRLRTLSESSVPADSADELTSLPSTPRSCISLEETEPQIAATRGLKRKRPNSKEDALSHFMKMNEALNTKMDNIVGLMAELVQEKKRSNVLLESLVKFFTENPST